MPAGKDIVRVGITGSYGGLNLGDEAILQSIIAQLDILILGGGGILYDADARTYLREVSIAHEKRVPVFVYAIGAGPLTHAAAQAAVRECLKDAAMVTVREKSAHRVLEEAGLHREDVWVTADPALLLKPEPLPRGILRMEGLEGRRRLIGMSVREPGVAAPDLDEKVYHALIANAADFMVDRYDANVVFVPMERSVLDTQHSHAVIARMLRAQRATVLKGEYTSGQILSWMGKFDFALGMRLHFLIFAAIQGTPFVALPYAGKVSGFLEALGVPTPPLQLVNAGRLIAYLDDSWDRKRSMRTRIAENLPALQDKARETHRLLLEVLSGEKTRNAHVKAA
jgi:polysaccharide pyruvyl transferase WcaK-like protein